MDAVAGHTDIARFGGASGYSPAPWGGRVRAAYAMVVLGVLAATDSLVRQAGPPGTDPETFYIVPLSAMLVFGTVITFAYRNRANSPAHKRSNLHCHYCPDGRGIRTMAACLPPQASICGDDVFLRLPGDAYRVPPFSLHKVHRATLWAGGFLVVVYELRFPIGKTAAWHAFASWAQNLAR